MTSTLVILWLVYTVAPSGTMTSPVAFTVGPHEQRFPDMSACLAHAGKVKLDQKWIDAEVILRNAGGTVRIQCLPEGVQPALPPGHRALEPVKK